MNVDALPTQLNTTLISYCYEYTCMFQQFKIKITVEKRQNKNKKKKQQTLNNYRYS